MGRRGRNHRRQHRNDNSLEEETFCGESHGLEFGAARGLGGLLRIHPNPNLAGQKKKRGKESMGDYAKHQKRRQRIFERYAELLKAGSTDEAAYETIADEECDPKRGHRPDARTIMRLIWAHIRSGAVAAFDLAGIADVHPAAKTRPKKRDA